MCGIVGAISNRDVRDILIQGLMRLEYRGYDSAGLALVSENGLACVKKQGKVNVLQEAASGIQGKLGVAHTRWATHGIPSEKNAHPHQSLNDNSAIAVVHNGIIENFETLKRELASEGFSFTSDTDSEVIPHLIAQQLQKGKDLISAVQASCKKLKGAYAIAVICEDNPELMVCARHGSPLVIGLGFGENFVGSDALALQSVTNRFIYLEEGDTALVKTNGVEIFDVGDKKVKREITEHNLGQDSAEKGHYRHFMEKEIFEQPKSVKGTLENRLGDTSILPHIFGLGFDEVLEQTESVQIVACGTSYHAGMVARYWIESFVGIPCQVEIASEYRYRKKVISKNTLLITISQSGETADTLAALKEAKDAFLSTLCICNVYSSSLVRESEFVFMTNAGPEIGVASTKAFTTQLVALLLFLGVFAKIKNVSQNEQQALFEALSELPKLIEKTLLLNSKIEKTAEAFAEKDNALFLGRGVQYPVAMEGALKLKEISYIHAEAYPAGELKHGPLALVDKDMPIITVAPNDELYEKLKSNIQEVASRGGELFVFMDEKLKHKDGLHHHVISVPSVPEIIAPIIYTIPLQLLAYHVALIKGTDVDQPRNLAKSVTVE